MELDHVEDYELEGQMNIFDFIEKPNLSPLVAVSKVFAAAIKQMNIKEWKSFVFALMHIKWNEKNSNIVRVDKGELAQVVGIHSDANHLSEDLKRSIGELARHSFIAIDDKDKDLYDSGNFITRVSFFKNIVRVKFEEEFMPLFQEFDREKGYITLWAEDLFKMSSERSILFYEDLRLHCDTRTENTRIYSTKDLKNLFGIPKDGKGSYMRKDGHFDRRAFEARVIEPIVGDLAKCKMINLVYNEDGKPYEKIKRHGYVVGYEFTWTVSEHPAVASASEVKEVREMVEKDPQSLKILNDIREGKKKPKDKRDNFTNYKQDNEFDWDEYELKLLTKDKGGDGSGQEET